MSTAHHSGNRGKGQGKCRSLSFAKRARIAMIEKDLRVRDIAEELGVSTNTVGLAISKSMFRPTCERIAELLEIELEDQTKS